MKCMHVYAFKKNLFCLVHYSTKWPRTHAWHCVARIECLKALANVMGFMLVSVSLSIVLKKKELVQNNVFAIFRFAT